MTARIVKIIAAGMVCYFTLICPIYPQTGYPFMSHFSFNEDIDYDNFDFTQDNYRNILIANRKGIVIFDSRNWQLIPVAGFPTVIINDPQTEKVFVGTRQGFGYATRNNKGNYEYYPIENMDSAFETDKVHIIHDKVFFTNKHEIRYILKENHQSVISWKFNPDNPLQGSFIHGDELYFILEKTGLMKTHNDTFDIVKGVNSMENFIIKYSDQYNSVKTLVTTEENKVFMFDGHSFNEVSLEGSRYINASTLTDVKALKNGKIALSTLMGGCLIANVETGKTEYIINSRTGLPDDEIFAMKTDHDDGLWLCHTKGLTRIDQLLPVAGYSYYEGLEGELLSVAWFANSLYVGTTEGLYRLTEKRKYSEKIITIRIPGKDKLTEIPRNAAEKPDAADDDIIVIEDYIADTAPLEEAEGDPETDIRNRRRLFGKDRSASPKSETGSGIIGSFLKKIFDIPDDQQQQQQQQQQKEQEQQQEEEKQKEKKQQEQAKPSAHPETIIKREPDEVKKKRIYALQSISHSYSKVEKIRGKCKDLVVADGKLIAGTNNGLFEIRGEKAFPILPDQYITFLSIGNDNQTIYAGIDEGALVFYPSPSGWKTMVEFRDTGYPVYSIARTSDSVWFLGSDNSVWMVKISPGSQITETRQFTLDLEYSERVEIKIIKDTINLFLSSSIWQMNDSIFTRVRSFPGIYTIPRYYHNKNITWMRSDFRWEQFGNDYYQDYTGLLSIFSNVQYIFASEINGLWAISNNKEVYHITGNTGSSTLTFDAYIAAFSGDNTYFPLTFPEIDHNNRSLRIAFSAPWYISPSQTEFRYYIEGLNKNWSDWSYSSVVEYPVLPPGIYKLHLQARNSFGNSSREITLDFTINPPFWETSWFNTLALMSIVGLVILIMQIRQRSLIRTKRILEEKVILRTREIVKQKNEIAEQKQEITDSIYYAQQIQQAILPSEKTELKDLSGYFVLFLPRDIVSGDFYWHKSIQDKTIIAAGDCTGHGVPGAIMSMLGVSFLNEIVPGTKFTNAAHILNLLRKHVNETLSTSGNQEKARDGMDIAICVIDGKKRVLDFAGAFNPLYYIRNNELTEIKGDKMPIGYYEKNDSFTNHQIKIKKGDIFYIFSDGFVDQFGGPDDKKYLSNNFKKLLLSMHTAPMQEQKTILLEEYKNWKGKHHQVDDVLIFGFCI